MTSTVKSARELINKTAEAALQKSIAAEEARKEATDTAVKAHKAALESLELAPDSVDPVGDVIRTCITECEAQSVAIYGVIDRLKNRVLYVKGLPASPSMPMLA